LEDVTENTKPKIIWPTINHPSKLRHINFEPKFSQELIMGNL
jgi:hypothetical protein